MKITPNPKGQLMALADAAERGNMSVNTLQALMRTDMAPPGFKRPGSHRWLFWSSEFDEWLERGRARAG